MNRDTYTRAHAIQKEIRKGEDKLQRLQGYLISVEGGLSSPSIVVGVDFSDYDLMEVEATHMKELLYKEIEYQQDVLSELRVEFAKL